MNQTKELVIRFKKAYRKGGIFYILNRVKNLIPCFLEEISLYFPHFYYRLFRSGRTFIFKGENYKYFYHKYNTTWDNERCVEVPIIWEMVRKGGNKRILEVGDVLSHYFCHGHDVLDKYEKREGVINEDVVDFKPTEKYDLIVSISTMEHIGFDYPEKKDPQKILKAFENLKSILNNGGQIVFTLPLGWNPSLDDFLRKKKIPFSERYCMKRVSTENRWVETSWEDIKNYRYNFSSQSANAIIVGIIKKNNKNIYSKTNHYNVTRSTKRLPGLSKRS